MRRRSDELATGEWAVLTLIAVPAYQRVVESSRATACHARRASAVRWGVARGIVVAWVVTLPASAAMGAAGYWVGKLLGG